MTDAEPTDDLYDPSGLYTAREVASTERVHIQTVFRWVREGLLPPPVRIGPRAARYRGRDLNAAHHRNSEN